MPARRNGSASVKIKRRLKARGLSANRKARLKEYNPKSSGNKHPFTSEKDALPNK
jgi:hypothetical protein